MNATNRTLRFTPAHDDHAALLALHVGKTDCVYQVEQVEAEEFQVAYRLTKLDADSFETYRVTVEGALAQCDCPAGHYRGRCKHADAVRELIRRGALPGPKARQHVCTTLEEWAA